MEDASAQNPAEDFSEAPPDAPKPFNRQATPGERRKFARRAEGDKPAPDENPAMYRLATVNGAVRTPSCTRKEKEIRVNLTKSWLAEGRDPAYIRQEFRTRWRKGFRCADGYIAEARNRMAENTDKPREIHIAEALEWLLNFRNREGLKPVDALKAHKEIIALLGLRAPVKIAATNADGSDAGLMVNIDATKIPLEFLTQLMQAGAVVAAPALEAASAPVLPAG